MHGARNLEDQSEQISCHDIDIRQELENAVKSNHEDNEVPRRRKMSKTGTTSRRQLNS